MDPGAGDAPHGTRTARGDRAARWERTTRWPLLSISLLFLASYSVQVIAQPDGLVRHLLNGITWVVWAAFAVDYVVSLVLAQHRLRWIVRHPLDLALVIFPGLAMLRLARFISLVVLLQRHAGALVRGRVVTYVVGASSLVTWVAAVGVLDVERGAPGGNIETIGDSLWWAIATITTVGYGDYTPVTLPGRLIAVGLMICGIALVGVITATFASWLIGQVRTPATAGTGATGHDAPQPPADADRSSVRPRSDAAPGSPSHR
ncbi:potassium channel family protein [Brachybacterium halotolerans subsp. kimchii]|uniref:potassium channel family protein n=1 Tax=Brachybacterium halotolerans TaxID=2795215 RepID=UPI001E4DBBC2|nr:potassium channel family protein [Brachybacterium halotolerans]UEJ83094.1 potassium channel family protein [Brachybacterium halotolerans subsp. kimchii]